MARALGLAGLQIVLSPLELVAIYLVVAYVAMLTGVLVARGRLPLSLPWSWRTDAGRPGFEAGGRSRRVGRHRVARADADRRDLYAVLAVPADGSYQREEVSGYVHSS